VIYFLQPTEGGPIKIGFTGNLDGRRAQLESLYQRPLALLATKPGGRPEEAAIHARFAHLRIGKEQFRPAPELLAFIGRPLLVDANPDAVEAMEHTKPIVAFRASREYVEWLERAAKFNGDTVAAFLARGAAKQAKELGFTEPPPERIP
jgi:hypothetical protein